MSPWLSETNGRVRVVVKTQRPICLQNNCGAIYDEREVVSAILWYAKAPGISRKSVYMHGCYPAVSIGREKIHVHRLLMRFWKKDMALKGMSVHHRDGNKLNATRENLELVANSAHISHHTRGRKLNEAHVAQMVARNRARKGVRHKASRADVTPERVYRLKERGLSYNAISKIVHLDWACVKRRHEDYVRDNPELLEVGT